MVFGVKSPKEKELNNTSFSWGFGVGAAATTFSGVACLFMIVEFMNKTDSRRRKRAARRRGHLVVGGGTTSETLPRLGDLSHSSTMGGWPATGDPVEPGAAESPGQMRDSCPSEDEETTRRLESYVAPTPLEPSDPHLPPTALPLGAEEKYTWTQISPPGGEECLSAGRFLIMNPGGAEVTYLDRQGKDAESKTPNSLPALPPVSNGTRQPEGVEGTTLEAAPVNLENRLPPLRNTVLRRHLRKIHSE